MLQGRRVPLGKQGSLFLIPFHLHHGAPHAQLHCMTQMEHTRKMKTRVDYSLASFHLEFLKYAHTSSVVLRRQCELQRVKFSSGTSDFLLVSNAHESRMQFGSSDAALKFCVTQCAHLQEVGHSEVLVAGCISMGSNVVEIYWWNLSTRTCASFMTSCEK